MNNEKKYFYGNEISEYGIENGYVDYGTLSKCFGYVLNDDIIPKTENIGYWEIIAGTDYDEENDTYFDIYQYYIVPEYALEYLQEANEIVFYNEALDMYVWGVTHLGTSWDYVLTDIKIDW